MTPERMHEICAEFRRELPGILDGRDEALQRWAKQFLRQEPLTMRSILEAVCSETKIRLEDILGRRQDRNVVRARQMTAWLIAELMPWKTQGEIGKFLKRDARTICHDITRLADIMDYHSEVRGMCQRLLSRLR